jgi:hypothetical protein
MANDKKIKDLQDDLKLKSEDLQADIIDEFGEINFTQIQSLPKKDRKKYNSYREASRGLALAASHLGKLIEK